MNLFYKYLKMSLANTKNALCVYIYVCARACLRVDLNLKFLTCFSAP